MALARPTERVAPAPRINETVIPVRFHEVDQMRVVHHSYYLVYMEVARFAFAARALGVTQADLDAWGVQVPVRRCECEYLHPARFGDSVRVAIYVRPRPEAALHLSYRLYREADGRLLATGRTVNVFLNREGRLLLNTPPPLRERLERALREHPEIVEG
ncbi:MAG: thioesterase family protein [Symbiobacterium sp.]|uniref:acyl-CoA thioesterase n=1 Tax=Symbiobacterium sp. TaxID=1971213 RepID=UPI003463BB58